MRRLRLDGERRRAIAEALVDLWLLGEDRGEIAIDAAGWPHLRLSFLPGLPHPAEDRFWVEITPSTARALDAFDPEGVRSWRAVGERERARIVAAVAAALPETVTYRDRDGRMAGPLRADGRMAGPLRVEDGP